MVGGVGGVDSVGELDACHAFGKLPEPASVVQVGHGCPELLSSRWAADVAEAPRAEELVTRGIRAGGRQQGWQSGRFRRAGNADARQEPDQADAGRITLATHARLRRQQVGGGDAGVRNVAGDPPISSPAPRVELPGKQGAGQF